MSKYIVLYNPLSAKGHGLENAKKLETLMEEGAEFSYEDMTKVTDTKSYMASVPEDTTLIFTGGDGTLNRVVNQIYDLPLERDVYYFPAGSGNDFINDLELPHDCAPFPINPYIKELPLLTANGEEHRYITSASLGLDGYCCDVVEVYRQNGKKIAYTMVAFEGLLWKYKPTGGTVTVDGVSTHYDKIWLAAAMFGRFYGGGVKMAPRQSRFDEDGKLTLVVIHDIARIPTLFIFLNVIKGKGEKYPKHVQYFTGHQLEVHFDKPTSLQFDGEPISDVTDIKVCSGRLA